MQGLHCKLMYGDICWDRKCGIWRDCALAVSRLVHCATQGVLRCARFKVSCALCNLVYVEMCKVAERNRRYDPDVPGLGGCISWHLLGFVPSEMVLLGTGWRITGDQVESLWCRTLQGTLTERYTLWGLDYDIYVRTSLISHVLLKKQIFLWQGVHLRAYQKVIL